jgi:peroxiredoxin Q/BCP
MIAAGAKLPEFRLQTQDGKWATRDDYKGRWLVLYIYPKDDTPGCTIQGKSFTATKDDFTKAGAVVVGLSEDDVGSHKDFCNKFSFTIDLLADPKKELLGALGIGQSEYKGAHYWDRTTVVVAPDGVVRKVYEKVSPQGHEQTLLGDLKAMANKH